MNHSELVQLATDLMSDAEIEGKWLPSYDAALSSAEDAMLESLIQALYADAASRDLRGINEAVGVTSEVAAELTCQRR